MPSGRAAALTAAAGYSRWERAEQKILQASAPPGAASRAGGLGEEGRWSLLDLTSPIRSQIFFNMVVDSLCYNGANEVNVHLDTIRCVCRELRDQIDEECLTFNYDDACGLGVVGGEHEEMKLLNCWIRRYPRLKYFDCLLRSVPKFRALLQVLELPEGTRCSFVLEFKVGFEEVRHLLRRFRVRRLSLIPEECREGASSSGSADRSGSREPPRAPREQAAPPSGWPSLPDNGLHVLCLRSCSDEIVRSFLASSPRLQGLQIIDSRLLSDPGVASSCLTSLSLTGVCTMPDEQFGGLISSCQNLRSLYISKCHISNIIVALPQLELLSITHCRQLTDKCATELLQPGNNPALRFLDLTEDRGLASPSIAHPGLEIAWLMHCPQLTDQAVAQMFQSCPSLTAANLVQSSLESALICSPALRTLELTTSQKLTDAAVTQLLQHCPSLLFLDVGHCCELLEPTLAHQTLETVLLSFCVNLRESAIVGLFADCPSLRYVELAVCMFDMTRFQRECGPNCQVVVNFDF
mmetsp:Transcript_50283/g.150165  ORF Transcript_50283/g.150165 Transcript_50283/m.150165 type:complete len:523 (+) Transcript_50283:57-1625(+)